jgi:hypothetical protein
MTTAPAMTAPTTASTRAAHPARLDPDESEQPRSASTRPSGCGATSSSGSGSPTAGRCIAIHAIAVVDTPRAHRYNDVNDIESQFHLHLDATPRRHG